MKKAILIDILEHLAKAHALTEYTASFTDSSMHKSQLHSAKFHVEDCLEAVKTELKK